MELKLTIRLLQTFAVRHFNRTNMELKLGSILLLIFVLINFNRTNMELKPSCRFGDAAFLKF